MVMNLRYSDAISYLKKIGISPSLSSVNRDLSNALLYKQVEVANKDPKKICGENVESDHKCHGMIFGYVNEDWQKAQQDLQVFNGITPQIPSVIENHVREIVSHELPGFNFTASTKAVLGDLVLEAEGIL